MSYQQEIIGATFWRTLYTRCVISGPEKLYTLSLLSALNMYYRASKSRKRRLYWERCTLVTLQWTLPICVVTCLNFVVRRRCQLLFVMLQSCSCVQCYSVL